MPNIQDLSADYYAEDDEITVEEEKRAKRKKRNNYIIGLSITGVLLIGLGLIYYFLATDWIADYRTLPYLTFRYSKDGDTAVITNIVLEQEGDKETYPVNFRIPNKINGRRIVGIEDQAFMGASRLKKVTMNDYITYIGDECFSGCTNLETIEFSSSLTSIGTDAFAGTKYLANLPSDSYTVVNSILVNVGNDFFEPNTVLLNDESKWAQLSVDPNYADCHPHYFSELPTVDYWLDGLFRGNDRLVYVDMPNYLDYVPVRAFQDCKNLVGIDFPDNVSSIGNYAFSGCTNLTDADVPEQITSVGDYAFQGTDATIEDISHVTELGVGAFQNCSGVTTINFPALDNVPNYCFDGCENLTTIDFVDESLIFTIGRAAFRNTALSEFTIPHCVTYLLENTFNGCENLESVSFYNNTLATTHSTYSYRTYVDEYGDEELQVFENVYTDGVETIYNNTFSGCTSLSNISLYDYTDASKSEFATVSGTDKDGSFNFPVTFTQDKMSDDANTFTNTLVTELNFNSGLQRLGNYAFDGCTSLEKVTFPLINNGDETYTKESEFTRLSEGCFRNCTSLTGFNYVPPKLSYVGAYCFQNDVSLTSFDMSDTMVSYIYASAFENCTSLSEFAFSTSTTAMNTGALAGCVSLTSVIVPSQLRTIQAGAFANEVDETHTDNLIIYYEATESVVSTSTYLASGWYDDTCTVYLMSEEQPVLTEGEEPYCDGYWHYDANGDPEIWTIQYVNPEE
ncbi:MAG: leucine-rich repeat domain-containing protein [Coprobacillus sp.]|nr:leucine-rich repeat domain-containing protein [Coprobacillus sp.]